jgi:hypothetical protein
MVMSCLKILSRHPPENTKETQKKKNPSAKMSKQTEIKTEHLQNICPEHYRYNKVLGSFCSVLWGLQAPFHVGKIYLSIKTSELLH